MEVKYKTIVIDIPWPVPTLSESVGQRMKTPLSKGLPYSTMTKDEILNFPIEDYADKDCMLFMWTVQSMLLFSLDVVKSWGFKFHLLMTWNKIRGINHLGFFRNAEFVIVAYRGRYGVRMDRKNIPVVFTEMRGKHSEKPQKFYSMIEKVTDGPRIDIFARKIRHGWSTFGDDPNLKQQPLESFIVE